MSLRYVVKHYDDDYQLSCTSTLSLAAGSMKNSDQATAAASQIDMSARKCQRLHRLLTVGVESPQEIFESLEWRR